MELRMDGTFVQLSKEEYDELLTAKIERDILSRMVSRSMEKDLTYASLETLAEIMGIEATKKDATGQD